MAWTLRIARFYKKFLAILWESWGLGTLLLPVWTLCWKISDAIKASTVSLRGQPDSYIATTQVGDEVEFLATEGEATARASDRFRRHETLAPAAQQLNFRRKSYKKMRCNGRRDIAEGFLEGNQDNNTRRRRGESARPLGLRNQSDGPRKTATIDVVGVSQSQVRATRDSYASCAAPSGCGDVGDYATKRSRRVASTELLRDRETWRRQEFHAHWRSGASQWPEGREPSKQQAQATPAASNATPNASHAKRRTSSARANNLDEVMEPSCRHKRRAGANPRPVTGAVSALSSAETGPREPICSARKPTASSDTSKLDMQLARSSSRRAEANYDSLPSARSERKPALQRPYDKARDDDFPGSSVAAATSLRAEISGRPTRKGVKKENRRFRPASRKVQKSREPSARGRKLSRWQPEQRDRSEASGPLQMSGSRESVQSRYSKNTKAAPRAGSPPTESGIRTTQTTRPGSASGAVPRRCSRQPLAKNDSGRHWEPTAKQFTGTPLQKPSVDLPGEIEECRSLKRQPSARTPPAVETHEGESSLGGCSPLEGASGWSHNGAAAASHWPAKQGRNISSCPSTTSESTPLAFRVPSSAISTGLDAQADKATANKQRDRRWTSKNSDHLQVSWEQWCKKRAAASSNGSTDSTAVNSPAKCWKVSLVTSRNATGTVPASAASTVIRAPGSGKLTRAFDGKLPTEPAGRTRPPAPTGRTLTLPCLEKSVCNCYAALSSWNWPAVQPCSRSEALSSSLLCSCSADFSPSCFGLHGSSQRAKYSALVESDEVAAILDQSGRHGASFWPFSRRYH